MGDADLATDTAAMRRVKADITGDQGKSMAALLAVFIARQFDQSIAQAIVQEVCISTELLDESPLYREWVSRAEAKGKAEGQVESALLDMR